jgi:hypothetical protein
MLSAGAGPLWVRVRYSRPGGGDLRVGVGAGLWAGRLLPPPPPSRPLLPQHLRIYRTHRQQALTNNRIFHSVCLSTRKRHPIFVLSRFLDPDLPQKRVNFFPGSLTFCCPYPGSSTFLFLV